MVPLACAIRLLVTIVDGGEGVDKFEIYLPDWNTAAEGFVGAVDLNLGFAGSATDLDNPLSDKLVDIENVTIVAKYGYEITGNDTNNILVGGSGDDTR